MRLQSEIYLLDAIYIYTCRIKFIKGKCLERCCSYEVMEHTDVVEIIRIRKKGHDYKLKGVMCKAC